MKFRLLGLQETLLDDTGHLSPRSLASDGYLSNTGPTNGILDWPEEDLMRLAHYAYVRAEANSSGYTLTASDRAEVRSLFALASRIRKQICKSSEHKACLKPFRSALGQPIACPCKCHKQTIAKTEKGKDL